MSNSSLDALYNKIKNLHGMANSNSPHEAAIAAVKLQKILREHELSLDDILASGKTSRSQYEAAVIIDWTNRLSKWEDILINAVAECLFCKAIRQSRRAGIIPVKQNIRNTKGYKYDIESRIIAVGKPEHLELVKYQFNNIVGQLDRLVDIQFNLYRGVVRVHGKKWKQDFCRSAVIEICNKMRAAKKTDLEINPALNRLALARQNELEQFIKSQHGELTPGKSGKRNFNFLAWEAGQRAGRELQVQAALENSPDAEILELE